MRIPQLRMEAAFAKLAISTEPAQLEITQPPAEVTIEQPHPELEINVLRPRLTIDQSQAWAEMNLKHVFRLIEDAVKDGYETWLAYVETVSVQGDELMKIENGGDVIAEQAQANSEGPPLEFNVGLVPSPFSVKIDYEPGKLMMDWKIHQPMIDVKPHRPVIHYQPGALHIDLAQHNSLRINVVT